MDIKATYTYIKTQPELSALVTKLSNEPLLSIDTETTGLDVLDPTFKLILLQIGVGSHIYIIDARAVSIIPLKTVLENPNITKIVQNGKYDYKVLFTSAGIRLRGLFDTLLTEHILVNGLPKQKNDLASLAKRYLDITLDKSAQTTFNSTSEITSEQLQYACLDTAVLVEIYQKQLAELKKYDLEKVAALEFKVIEPTAHMELYGFRLDTKRWSTALEKTKKRAFKYSAELLNVLPAPKAPPPKPVRLKKDGTPYKNNAPPKPPPVLNLDSPLQIKVALEEVGIDLQRSNKITGKGLTNNATLKKAAELHSEDPLKVKILKDMIVWRATNQTLKTFGDNLIECVRSDGRIHADFVQDGTQAGRYSCRNPNLENIQKKGNDGEILRTSFIPDVGYKFAIADYGALHLRLAAEFSQDPAMRGAFIDGADLHRRTAALMFGIPELKVLPKQRQAAKTINFSLLYGAGPSTLAINLNVSEDEAKDYLNRYHEAYPVLNEWLYRQSEAALKNGFVKSAYGRIRWLPLVDPADEEYKKKISYQKRIGKNHPILATDGDMLKMALLELHPKMVARGARIVNIIHDEVVIEAPDTCIFDCARILKDTMLTAAKFFIKTIPVTAEVKIRDEWYKDDIDAGKLGITDDETGQQLWLMRYIKGLEDD